jgi:hypothetical protein
VALRQADQAVTHRARNRPSLDANLAAPCMIHAPRKSQVITSMVT